MTITDPQFRSEADLAEQRYRFLLTASTMLSAALDFESAIDSLGRLAVPALADLCLIDMMDPSGTLTRAGTRAVDPELAEAMGSVHPVPNTNHPAGGAVLTGEPVLTPLATDHELQVLAGNDANFALLQENDLRWSLSVPIVARSSLGALTLLARTGSYAGAEVVPDLAVDLARRAALALDNARLFESSRNMAVTLQRSLMPAGLPTIPELDLAARYHAGGEGTEVGGDFYDVFPTGTGGKSGQGWAAVIGDVCGKGAEAAALSALARHTIRAANVTFRKPRRILAFLNQLVLQGEYQRFITVAYCRIRPVGEGVQLTLGRAGHPPPLLLRREGGVLPLGKPGTLIGVTSEPNLTDQVTQVLPGESLLLYTDGVTEARGQDGRFGQSRLEEELAGCSGLGAQEIADRLERAVLNFQTGPSHDDMAMLVIRVAPDIPHRAADRQAGIQGS